MKKLCCFFAAIALLLSLVLTACQPGGTSESADPNADKTCREGVCAEINVLQPIVLNQPADVIITLSSTVDKSGLKAILAASPSNAQKNPDTPWNFDAVANQSQEFHATITFTSPGGYLVYVQVFETGGPIVVNQEYIIINSSGATVNPTRSPLPNMSQFPAQPSRSPEQMTETAQAEPTLPPLPQLSGFTPQEWIQRCGWSVKQASKLSELRYITPVITIPSAAAIGPGEQVNGTIGVGFKDPKDPNAVIQAKIGLCTFGEGWTTSTTHEWNTELHHGIPFEAPITVSFTKSGPVAMFIVVLDTKNNRVAGYGQMFEIAPKGQKSSLRTNPSSDATTQAATTVTPVTVSSGLSWYLLASEQFNSSSWPTGFPL